MIYFLVLMVIALKQSVIPNTRIVLHWDWLTIRVWRSQQDAINNLNTLQWSDAPDYPFSSENKYIYAYSVAETTSAAYIIGGYNTEEVVAQFKDFQWRRLADLNKGRTEHGSISIGHQTMIIGGYVSTSE